jgi:hypothetical protein
VVAERVLRGGSLIEGGPGLPVLCGDPSPTHAICTMPDGAPVVANELIDLGSALFATGPMNMGASWTLFWNTPSPSVLLAVSTELVPPASLGGLGWLFLDPDSLVLLSLPSGGLNSASGTFPSSPVLVGVGLGIQVLDAQTGLTRPVIGILTP